jgi:hypothetical protein
MASGRNAVDGITAIATAGTDKSLTGRSALAKMTPVLGPGLLMAKALASSSRFFEAR